MPPRPALLEQLIGAPLRALVLGQGLAAQATAEFVADVGLASEADGSSSARTFDFTYLHPVPDPANPGAVIETPTRVTVPLLSLFSIPQLAIAEATVDFRVNIVDVRQFNSRREGRTPGVAHLTAANVASLFPQRLRLVASYASGAPKRNEAAVAFSIKVVREPASEGMNAIQHLLSEAVQAEPLKSPGDDVPEKRE